MLSRMDKFKSKRHCSEQLSPLFINQHPYTNLDSYHAAIIVIYGKTELNVLDRFGNEAEQRSIHMRLSFSGFSSYIIHQS